MHPAMLEPFAEARQAELRAARSPRLVPARRPRRRRELLGWLLVDLGLRMALSRRRLASPADAGSGAVPVRALS